MEGQAKVATEFLIYAYFKLDVQADEKEIIGKVIERAYADATNEGAYNTRLYDDMQDPTKEDKQNRKTVSDGVREEAAKYIVNLIDRLPRIESEDVFDAQHTMTCQALVTKFNEALGSQKFTYGNAQKWVNMTIKYLYLIDGVRHYYGKTLSIHEGIDKCQKWFHVPVDSYIMEAIYKDIELPRREQGRPQDIVKKRTFQTAQSKDLLPWSQWEQKHYMAVYRDIRKHAQKHGENICPLVWENSAWIETAKGRKK